MKTIQGFAFEQPRGAWHGSLTAPNGATKRAHAAWAAYCRRRGAASHAGVERKGPRLFAAAFLAPLLNASRFGRSGESSCVS